ncbi:MAG: hypothetical protein AB1Z98_31570 [Nannocystaceae bacterium]
MTNTTIPGEIRSGRSRHQAPPSRGSMGRLALATALLAGGCDLAEGDGLEPEVEEYSFRGASSWVQSFRDMATAAMSSYDSDGHGGQPRDSIEINGVEHTRATSLTNNEDGVRVSVFEYQTCQTASIVVSFRGTQVPNFCDLADDAAGATTPMDNPTNPWDPSIVTSGEVGQGFYNRVERYMKSPKGQALKDYVDKLQTNGQKVNFHVVGHSLGGVSSALFSQFLAQYTKKTWDSAQKDKLKHYNFAFNSPLGMDDSFRNNSAQGFYGLANQKWFTPFGFNVDGDLVSSFNYGHLWSQTYDDSTTVTADNGQQYRPFAHLALPGSSLLTKHKLDVNIGQWAHLVEERSDDMGAAYEPFAVGPTRPSPSTPDCGCDLYIEGTCKLP